MAFNMSLHKYGTWDLPIWRLIAVVVYEVDGLGACEKVCQGHNGEKDAAAYEGDLHHKSWLQCLHDMLGKMHYWQWMLPVPKL